MKLPDRYAWLEKELAPKMLIEGLKTYGIVETPGEKSNPIILGWAKEVGLQNIYTADATPWCGLWMALVAKRADKPVPLKPLWALNWSTWGQDGGQPELGDVLVFVREGGGHVGIYVGEDNSAYHVLGGNTRDSVSIGRVDKKRLHACRAYYEIGKPINVRPVILSSHGELSTNEA